jgi:hypothetical protein
VLPFKTIKKCFRSKNSFKAEIENKELFKPSMDNNGFDFGLNT